MKTISEIKAEEAKAEEAKLSSFLQKFLIRKETKIRELKYLGQFFDEKRTDFDVLEDILKNQIRLHKEGKQECDEIINIIGEYANSNF